VESFTEAEIQVLISLIELAEPKETPNNNFYTFYPKTLEQAATYFRKFREDWSDAFRILHEQGLVQKTGDGHVLTEAGKVHARQIRGKRPPIWYWYREYYLETTKSKAHARYCERVFGRDLCQHGFADMAQLDKLLEVTDLRDTDRVLDLGCGSGLISEHLSDRTGARVTGIDYVPEGITLARERTRDRRDRLDFIEMDIDALDFSPGTFDAVVSIDTLYFPASLQKTVGKLKEILRHRGQMAIFYGSERLLPQNTNLGRALTDNDLSFTAYDFTRENYEHLRRKRKVVEELKDGFAAEGNQFLYENLYAESELGEKPFDPATFPAVRYLYHVKR